MILSKVSMDIHSCSRHVCLAGQDAAVGSFLFYFNWKQRDGFGSFLWEENGLCVGRQAASFHYRRCSRASHVQYIRHSPGTVFSPASSRYSFTVYIQYIYFNYTVRVRARWRCSEIGTHHLNYVNSTSLISMYTVQYIYTVQYLHSIYTVYTVCTYGALARQIIYKSQLISCEYIYCKYSTYNWCNIIQYMNTVRLRARWRCSEIGA